MADMPLQITAKTAGRGRPFEKGRSGNPAGRPRGSTNRATKSAAVMLDGEAEALTRKAVELALGGDASALRLCLERIVGPHRGRPVEVDAAADQERRRYCRHDGRAYRRRGARRRHPRRGGRDGESRRHLGAVDRDQRLRPPATGAGGPCCVEALMLVRSAATRAANRDGSGRFRPNRPPPREPRRRYGAGSGSVRPFR